MYLWLYETFQNQNQIKKIMNNNYNKSCLQIIIIIIIIIITTIIIIIIIYHILFRTLNTNNHRNSLPIYDFSFSICFEQISSDSDYYCDNMFTLSHFVCAFNHLFMLCIVIVLFICYFVVHQAIIMSVVKFLYLFNKNRPEVQTRLYLSNSVW